MSRYIDRDAVRRAIKEYCCIQEEITPDGIAKVVMSVPTVDVVEVVRCKDCKYLYCLSAIDRQFYCRHFPKGLTGINIIEDNPYCSYGERKEG